MKLQTYSPAPTATVGTDKDHGAYSVCLAVLALRRLDQEDIAVLPVPPLAAELHIHSTTWHRRRKLTFERVAREVSQCHSLCARASQVKGVFRDILACEVWRAVGCLPLRQVTLVLL